MEDDASIKLMDLGGIGHVIVKKLKEKEAEIYMNDTLIGQTENIVAWTTLAISYKEGSLIGMVDGNYTTWNTYSAQNIGDTLTLEGSEMRPDYTNLEFYDSFMTERDTLECLEVIEKEEAVCPSALLCVYLNTTHKYGDLEKAIESRSGSVHFKLDGVLVFDANVELIDQIYD